MADESEAPPSFWALVRGQTKPRKSTAGQPLALPNPEATMSLSEQFKADPVGAVLSMLRGATLPVGPESQASRFGELLAAGAPIVGGLKPLKAVVTGERAAEEAAQATKGIRAY